MILCKTTDKLKVKLGGAVTTNELSCAVFCAESSRLSSHKISYLKQTNGTTFVELCDPLVSNRSNIEIEYLAIQNKDTVSTTVMIVFEDNGTDCVLWCGVLAVNQILTYKSTTGWEIIGSNTIGYPLFVQALTSSPADAQTVYFGNMPKAPTTTANVSKVYIPKSGILKVAEIYCYSGTAGTNESWSLYIRLNNTTDYLINTLSLATSERRFNNNAMGIVVSAGDYIEIKGVQPTWVTNPLTTIYGGFVYIE